MKDQNSSVSSFDMEVTISDIILTPLACASIINEILKGLLYQKCQIPYPYNWMKSLVAKKRQKAETEMCARTNFKAESHFRQVSSVLDTLEAAMGSITNEFLNSRRNVKKVVIVLGTTPYSASEVFTIAVSSLADGHIERNHITQLNQYQHKILRSIFLSQDWLDKVDASLSCTNIYLYLIKTGQDLNDNPSFVPTQPLDFSTKTKHFKISLHSESQPNENCCENLTVFEDISHNLDVVSKNFTVKECEDNLSWFKYKDLVKGFRDCFVNKKSISELW